MHFSNLKKLKKAKLGNPISIKKIVKIIIETIIVQMVDIIEPNQIKRKIG